MSSITLHLPAKSRKLSSRSVTFDTVVAMKYRRWLDLSSPFSRYRNGPLLFVKNRRSLENAKDAGTARST
jgi:hypothetical protein